MKIFIDTTKWLRIKEENETPIVSGNNYVDKITVYYNSDPSNAFFPTLNILKPNNRVVGGVVADATETYPQQETIDGTTWYYFDFTLSANNHQIDVPGKYQITIVTNFYNSTLGTITGNRNINTFLVVQNASVFDNGNIIVFGDDPSDVVASMLTIINSLQTTINNINSNKADRNNDEQDITAHDLTVDSLAAASGITIDGVAVADKDYVDNTKADRDNEYQEIIAGMLYAESLDSTSGSLDLYDETRTSNINIGAGEIDYSATYHVFDGIVNADTIQSTGNTVYIMNNANAIAQIKSDEFSFTDVNSNSMSFKNNALTVNKVTGLGAPTNNSDATSKLYVDLIKNILQDQINTLNSVQNVVDVVATKAALEAYDTLHLMDGDKIQVIADESITDSPTTIYSYDEEEDEFVYVGAYGGNSYTKTQTDTKLQAYAKLNDGTQDITANKYSGKELVIEPSNNSQSDYLKFDSDNGYGFSGFDLKTDYFSASIYHGFDFYLHGTDFNVNNAGGYNFVNSENLSYTWGVSFTSGQMVILGMTDITIAGTSTITLDPSGDDLYPVSITGVATPTEATGAANKSYVDNTINSSFLTDAEMTTLISEVFD